MWRLQERGLLNPSHSLHLHLMEVCSILILCATSFIWGRGSHHEYEAFMYTEAKLISDVILIKELMMKEGSSLFS